MIRNAAVVMIASAFAAAQSQPTFRAGARLIQIDVSVQNSKGSVRGLTKDDFTVQDKGKTQNLAVFSVADTQAPGAASDPLPDNVASNRINKQGQALSAITVILYDRINTPATAQAVIRSQVLGLLSSLRPTDRVHPVTRGSEALVRTAQQLKSQGDKDSAGSGSDQEAAAQLRNALVPFQRLLDNSSRVRLTYGAFRAIARQLDGIPGRKNLIWVTSNIPFTYGTGTERRSDDEAEFMRMVRVLSDSNVAIYPIDPRGAGTADVQPTEDKTTAPTKNRLQGAVGQSMDSVNTLAGNEGLQRMANETGGRAYYNINDVTPAAREVLNASEVSYTLGFYVEEKALDGKVHDLNVKLGKGADTAGAKLFYRRDYVALKTAAAAAQAPTMNELIVDEANASGIGIMAATAPDPAKPGVHDVQVKVELADVQLEHRGDKWVGAFDLGFALVGANKVNVNTVNLNLTDEQVQQALKQGMVVDNTVPSPDKPTQLKVVVLDKTRGAAGSVLLPIAPR